MRYLSALTVIALSLSACSDDSRSVSADPPPLKTAPNGMQAGVVEVGWEEAEEITGFSLMEPSYLPEGLVRDGEISVVIEEGNVVGATFGYIGESGQEPISYVVIDQTSAAIKSPDRSGREITIESTQVFVSTAEDVVAPGQHLAQASWQLEGIVFELSVVSSPSVDSLEDEAIQIAESMIP